MFIFRYNARHDVSTSGGGTDKPIFQRRRHVLPVGFIPHLNYRRPQIPAADAQLITTVVMIMEIPWNILRVRVHRGRRIENRFTCIARRKCVGRFESKRSNIITHSLKLCLRHHTPNTGHKHRHMLHNADFTIM